MEHATELVERCRAMKRFGRMRFVASEMHQRTLPFLCRAFLSPPLGGTLFRHRVPTFFPRPQNVHFNQVKSHSASNVPSCERVRQRCARQNPMRLSEIEIGKNLYSNACTVNSNDHACSLVIESVAFKLKLTFLECMSMALPSLSYHHFLATTDFTCQCCYSCRWIPLLSLIIPAGVLTHVENPVQTSRGRRKTSV